MSAPEPKPPVEHLPGDYCRTCMGAGTLREPGDRPGVTVSERCWACDGTGWGK